MAPIECGFRSEDEPAKDRRFTVKPGEKETLSAPTRQTTTVDVFCKDDDSGGVITITGEMPFIEKFTPGGFQRLLRPNTTAVLDKDQRARVHLGSGAQLFVRHISSENK